MKVLWEYVYLLVIEYNSGYEITGVYQSEKDALQAKKRMEDPFNWGSPVPDIVVQKCPYYEKVL